jgi:GNAT superfamily N-acetyltransferase
VQATFRTLGIATDLELDSYRARVEQHDGFVAVRTPSNPGYHFGNYLVFDRPPQVGDAKRWPQLFDRVFEGDPNVEHAAFAWSMQDEHPGAIEPFLERGYSFAHRAVMTANSLRDFTPPQGVHIREFRCDRDWDAQLELGFATREPQYEKEPYERFKRLQVEHHRELTRRCGVWLGAFEGERLRGSCGIFSVGEGIARFQDVGVFAEYRNRGIARSLISAAGAFAGRRSGAMQLVIVADAVDFARRIYEHAGFTVAQHEGALWIAHR